MDALTQSRRADFISTLQNMPQPEKKTPQFRYPTAREEFRALDAIFTQELGRHLTPHERKSCEMLAKIFTLGVAHHDVYEMACQRVEITEEQLCKHLVGWRLYPEPLKNKWRKGAKKYLQTWAEESRSLKEFYARQAYHLDQFDDETAGRVLDLEESEVTLQHANDLRTYFAPDTSKEHSLTCKQIAANMANFTAGSVYLTPQEVAQELERRGFEKGGAGYYVKII
jgi:hypothetical protein